MCFRLIIISLLISVSCIAEAYTFAEEVARAFNREYCLRLLYQGDRHSYKKFIAAQVDNQEPYILKYDNFVKLSTIVQKLSIQEYSILQKGIVISAEHKNDRNEFLGSNQKLLNIMFLPQTNMRHMLHTEGGISMFRVLREAFKQNYINPHELDVWFAYWIVNIAGYQGHIDGRGALYLNESFYNCLAFMIDNILAMYKTPNYDPLTPYLKFRADQLGIGYEHLGVVHLACLMKMNNTRMGDEILTAFLSLPSDLKLEFNNLFVESLTNYEQITATYAPAYFLKELESTANIKHTLSKLLPNYVNRMRERAPTVQISFKE